jgi:23S rRNA (adenine2030-N6)-methyltransferase
MFGYRHAYHAGNHADVLKHMVEVACLRALTQKDKPLFYLDTHAGAGMYDLKSVEAQKNAEFKDGIGRVWNANDPPDIVQHYLDCIRSFQPGKTLEVYPGSPAIAAALLRPTDRLTCNEWHSTDIEYLKSYFARDKRTHCVHGDGLISLKALLPPKERRALIVIDPSYEVKEDYVTIPDALIAAYRKFSTGVYLLWYPVVFQDKVQGMLRRLEKAIPGSLNVTLSPSAPASDGRGMQGSGVFVVNPPWTLEPALKEAMPWLLKILADGGIP